MAVNLTHQALATHWQIVLNEPSRTLQTLLAAYLLKLLPLSFYQGCENLALKLTGISQQLHILRDRFKIQFA